MHPADVLLPDLAADRFDRNLRSRTFHGPGKLLFEAQSEYRRGYRHAPQLRIPTELLCYPSHQYVISPVSRLSDQSHITPRPISTITAESQA